MVIQLAKWVENTETKHTEIRTTNTRVDVEAMTVANSSDLWTLMQESPGSTRKDHMQWWLHLQSYKPAYASSVPSIQIGQAIASLTAMEPQVYVSQEASAVTFVPRPQQLLPMPQGVSMDSGKVEDEKKETTCSNVNGTASTSTIAASTIAVSSTIAASTSTIASNTGSISASTIAASTGSTKKKKREKEQVLEKRRPPPSTIKPTVTSASTSNDRVESREALLSFHIPVRLPGVSKPQFLLQALDFQQQEELQKRIGDGTSLATSLVMHHPTVKSPTVGGSGSINPTGGSTAHEHQKKSDVTSGITGKEQEQKLRSISATHSTSMTEISNTLAGTKLSDASSKPASKPASKPKPSPIAAPLPVPSTDQGKAPDQKVAKAPNEQAKTPEEQKAKALAEQKAKAQAQEQKAKAQADEQKAKAQAQEEQKAKAQADEQKAKAQAQEEQKAKVPDEKKKQEQQKAKAKAKAPEAKSAASEQQKAKATDVKSERKAKAAEADAESEKQKIQDLKQKADQNVKTPISIVHSSPPRPILHHGPSVVHVPSLVPVPLIVPTPSIVPVLVAPVVSPMPEPAIAIVAPVVSPIVESAIASNRVVPKIDGPSPPKKLKTTGDGDSLDQKHSSRVSASSSARLVVPNASADEKKPPEKSDVIPICKAREIGIVPSSSSAPSSSAPSSAPSSSAASSQNLPTAVAISFGLRRPTNSLIHYYEVQRSNNKLNGQCPQPWFVCSAPLLAFFFPQLSNFIVILKTQD
jgi:hypothetical protein